MNSSIERLLGLRVKDVMNTEVVNLAESSTMSEAAVLFSKYDITGAPVVNSSGACIGLLSVSDFAYRERQLALAGVTNELMNPSAEPENVQVDAAVGSFMSPVVQTINPDASILNAARVLLREHIHRLVIVGEDQEPIGVLSSLDLVGCMVAAVEE